MKKIKLEVDNLSVESFATEREPAPRGTVDGHFTAVRDGCQYPTPSCEPGQTYGEFTCFCLYGRTDEHICCNSDIHCTVTCQCGGGTGYSCAASCAGTCETCPPTPC
jgi:hypothetical protein